jgi:opacity protein-like surface antigen
MKQILFALLAAVVLTATATAAAPSVGGVWTMTVEGSPHGNQTMELTLTQKDTKVTGTFVAGHMPDMDVAGEFVDGELHIATAEANEDHQIVFTAKLKDDGTLAGIVSSPMGDMKWTATRASQSK